MNNIHIASGRMYTIGDISRICGIPASKLRYYDSRGVIRPCRIDESNGYRYYDDEAIMQMSLLKYYQDCGFKLRDIVKLMERMNLDNLDRMFTEHLHNLELMMVKIQKERDSIAAWQGLVRERQIVKEKGLAGVVRRKEYPEKRMIFSEPDYCGDVPLKVLAANVEMVNEIVGDKMSVGPLYIYFGDYYRTSVNDAALYIEPHPWEPDADNICELDGFEGLSLYVEGPFDDAGESVKKILEYSEKEGCELRGDLFERIVVDWWSTRNEEEFLVELIAPLK